MKNSRRFYIQNKRDKIRFFTFLILAVLVSAAASLCLGAVYVSPAQTLQALLGGEEGTSAYSIILYARLPRTCGSLLAGSALAVSGAVIQSVLDNPLAAPNIIGVNAGAGLAVALFCAAAPTAVALVPAAAFLGALGSVLLVLMIAERTGASHMTLVLAGVAISNVLGAGIDAIVTLAPDALIGYSDFRIGGLANVPMSRIIPAFWVIAAALAAVFSLAGDLDILTLGVDTARSLGLAAKRTRLILLALAAALAGAAVSFSGLLGFVGLIVPHIIRSVTGQESRPLLAASALGGAAFLTASDLLARLLFAPYELPVGIILSLAGGPFFIVLLLRQRGGRLP